MTPFDPEDLELFTMVDLLDMERRFNAIEREHNERQDEIGRGFQQAQDKILLDLEVEIPEFEW